MPSMPELLVVLLIVLLIFGANKLPGIGDALGRTIKNFKRSSSGKDELEVSKRGEIEGAKSSSLDGDVEEAEVVAAKK